MLAREAGKLRRPGPKGDRCEERVPHGQRGPVRARARAAGAARVRPARAARAERDRRRLRYLVVRRLHGAARRRIGEVVHRARRPGGRLRDHDDRRAGSKRVAQSAPGGVPRASRAPVRLLHERDGARRDELAGREPEPERGADPARARGQHLPLHRLPEHRGRDPGGGPMSAPTEVEVGRIVGAPVERKEDKKLLQGQAQWVDNMRVPGMVYLGVVRSPYAHARIKSVDVKPALAHSDVVAAWSGADIDEEWAGSLPCAWIPTEDTNAPEHKPVAVDKARYVGDAVAVIAATSRGAAEDAAELVEVEYEPLPAVVDPEAALADGAPIVHEQFGTNRCYTWTLEAGEVDRLFAEAAVVVSERYRQNRLIPNAIEPRAVFVTPIPATGEFTLFSTTQVPHIARVTLSGVTGIPEAKLRVIAPDVGGGFGSKLNVYAEEALALAVARRLGRAVKWTETRSEGYLSTIHGRDQIQEIELAATSEGRITAVRAKLTVGFGAYLQLVTTGIPLLGAWLYGGTYAVEGYSFECTGVFTNTVPTDAYRGAGRPEATYAIERAVDALARKLGKDPDEVRRLNFIREFPAEITSGLTIDSGDYDACLDLALEKSGYEAVRKEQKARRAAGDSKRLGIGLSTYVEMCGLAP